MGVAYQAGLIPISAAAIEEAIHLNKVDAERNLQAFLWGRKYYQDAPAVEALCAPETPPEDARGLAERRYADLAAYQNRRYADEYLAFVREVEARRPALAEAVARHLYKLMAYKDEYEVARLLTKPEAEARIRGMWEQVEGIGYNLHPPLLRALGWKRKVKLGGWFRGPLRALAAFKYLRGTRFDPFGYAAVRRQERELISWYRELVRWCLETDDSALAWELVSLPDEIRCYEHVKVENIRRVKAAAAEIRSRCRVPATTR
jgi:indolepyruvate ferredoxin oxidoreductase